MARKISPAVTAFIAGLPPDRRREVERVRTVIRKNLPAGYEEVVTKGMLVYQVPLERYADTYNGHPLWYIAIASQKSYLSLHLVSIYMNPALTDRLKGAGKKLNIGKGCVRFKSADELPLDVVGEIVAATPMDRWIAIAQAARRR